MGNFALAALCPLPFGEIPPVYIQHSLNRFLPTQWDFPFLLLLWNSMYESQNGLRSSLEPWKQIWGFKERKKRKKKKPQPCTNRIVCAPARLGKKKKKRWICWTFCTVSHARRKQSSFGFALSNMAVTQPAQNHFRLTMLENTGH